MKIQQLLLAILLIGTVTLTAQLPLLEIDELEYEGAFIVPPNEYGESNSNYAAGTFTLSGDNQSFFIAGHNVHGAIAEFEFPSIIKSDSLQDLEFATIKQNFKSLMDLTSDNNPQGLDRIAGMKVIDNRLFINAIEYYDAPANNTHTTLIVEDPDNIGTSDLSGYYHVEGEAHAGGWLTDIPSEWQSELGGAYLMGNSSKYAINGRLAMGISAFVFDPADFGPDATITVPTTTLLDFDLADPLYADFENYANANYNLVEVNGTTNFAHTFEDADAIVGTNSLWTSSSQASYGFIVPGTRTYMCLGSSGGHESGIGYKATQNNGNICGGPCPYDADDEYNYYWLWDVDDLIDVKNGVKQAYDIRPYDSGKLDLPFQYDDYYSESEFHEIVGGDFDKEKGILYLTVYDGGASGSPYQKNPVIVAYSFANYNNAIDPELGLELEHTGFTQPTKITHAGDDSNRLFVAEKKGKIKIIDSTNTVLTTPFLDLSGILSTNSERGLLGLAFHPDYVSNGFFYVYYTNTSGDSEISRYQVSNSDPNIADPNSGLLLLDFEQPYSNHNGGDINFGPDDGYLYIASGDGGSGNDPGCEAQDTTTALGKLLRIDVDFPDDNPTNYLIPSDNPFAGDIGAEQTIWSYGLRNPWRFSFDRDNGNLWIADVGQNAREEVDFDLAPLTGGINYGWKFMEGSSCISNNTTDPDCDMNPPPCGSPLYQNPLFEYNHNIAAGGESITGGHVYRGCKYPTLQGLYICADYSSGNFWTIDETGSNKIHSFLQTDISTFGEDEQGEIFCATLSGNIYRVIETSVASALTLTTSDSPLNGIYRAYDKIILQGNIQSGANNAVTLIAPEVEFENQVTAENNNILVIKNEGCQ